MSICAADHVKNISLDSLPSALTLYFLPVIIRVIVKNYSGLLVCSTRRPTSGECADILFKEVSALISIGEAACIEIVDRDMLVAKTQVRSNLHRLSGSKRFFSRERLQQRSCRSVLPCSPET